MSNLFANIHRSFGGAPRAVSSRSVGILSSGMWRKRAIIAKLLDGQPVRVWPWRQSGFDEIAGWGHKPTAKAALALAIKLGVPYAGVEDGFLRSVRPGDAEPSVGWIVDRRGIYYDSASLSDFEIAVSRRAETVDPNVDSRIRSALARISTLRLSKYNHAPMRSPKSLGLRVAEKFVFVIDQTAGDASVAGAGANEKTFLVMLEAAIADNPGRHVVVKLHPETINGRKPGHLVHAARDRRVSVISEDVNPWSVIENAECLYVVSSQLGFEAMLAGVRVVTFGQGFYSGWGLVDCRCQSPERRCLARREDIAAAAYLDYCRWIHPFSGEKIELEDAIEILAEARRAM